MGLGIPTVMSPVGVNTEIASGGVALLASTPEEWHEVLGRLIDDVELPEPVRGEVLVNDVTLRAGDAAAVTGEDQITVSGVGAEASEVLLFDLA